MLKKQRRKELGISREIAPRIFNHSVKGMEAVYDQFDYQKEKFKAMEKWNRKLDSIITGKRAKVIELVK